MTGWTLDRLPITWPPLPGEALDSWLQSYAARLRTSTRGLLNFLGLPGVVLTRMLNTLTEPETSTLVASCGLTPAQLTAMTLTRFDGIAVTIDPRNRQLAHPPAWRRQTGSRFCPTCLTVDGGRWQLRWRLPWTFACLRHDCMLLDYCPACTHRPAPDRPFHLTQPIATGRCSHPAAQPAGARRRGAGRGVCGHDLTDAHPTPLPPDGLVIAAQQHIDHLIDAAARGAEGHTGYGGSLTELHLLAFRVLHALHTSAAQPPAAITQILAEAEATIAFPGPLGSYDAVTVAVGATAAIAVNAEPDDTLIHWLVTNHLQHISLPEPQKILRGYKNAGPALTGRVLAALDPHLRTAERITYRTAGPQPQPPAASREQIARRAASLPALLWPAWSLALAPRARTGSNMLTTLRADLAVMLLLSGTPLNGHDAAELLGQPRHRIDLDAFLPAEGGERRAALSIINIVTADLDREPAPINYHRRRALFHTPTIDPHSYTALADRHCWPPASPLQLHLLNNHLKILLTGSPLTAIRDRRSADIWNPLAVALPPTVRAFLHEQGRQLLLQHLIHEPLRWQPPLPDHENWPGLAPAGIDSSAFADAFAIHSAHARGLRRISEATGLTSNQVRLLAHLTELDMPEDQWISLAAWTHQPGDPKGFADLHHDQHLPMADISRLTLTTELRIRTTLTETGRPPLSQHPSKKQISRQWFVDNYINTHKTVAQAAAELGISRNTFLRYARLHDIDTHSQTRPANPFTQWPADAQPPAAVIAACSARRGVEYLRQIAALLDYPTQRAAAAALGLHEQVLQRRRRYIEQAAGIRLCRPRTKFLEPVELTPEGTDFLHSALTAIHHLETQKRS
jgi:hypothetical protein